MGEPMDRSRRVFAPQTTFESEFPTVQSVTIALYERGKGVYGSERNTFGAAQPLKSGQIRCSNPKCERGGYVVDRSLPEMVHSKLSEKEFVKNCPGDEGSPKGRRKGDSCHNKLHYRLTIKYRP